jgi:undecaprenyl-diphosphatase
VNQYLLAAVLGVVEGLTEFLPVSSTAHIRLAQAAIAGRASLDDNFWKMFAVVIQLPAILAVIVYFWRRLLGFAVSFFAPGLTIAQRMRHPVTLVGIAFVVTAVPAVLAKRFIKGNLESLYVMGWALVVGGLIMYVVDRVFGERGHALSGEATAAENAQQEGAPGPGGRIDDITAMKPWHAAWIGAIQVLAAIFPGTSRSMATIAAGQTAGLTRTTALEFSFFLSIPIMIAACLKDLKDSLDPGDADAYIGRSLSAHDLTCIGIGSAASFVTALVVIAWFMAWVRRRGFTPFAVYRIVIGVVVLVWAGSGD